MKEFDTEVTDETATDEQEESAEYVSDFESVYEIIDSVVAQTNLSVRRKHIVSLGVRVIGELIGEYIEQRALRASEAEEAETDEE